MKEPSFFKKIIKKYIRPLYRRIINRLLNDLHINEHQRLLHHIVNQGDKLSENQRTLKEKVSVLSLLLSGVYEWTSDNHLLNEQTTEVLYDIFSILHAPPKSPIVIARFLPALEAVSFQNKSVCLIGRNQNLYSKYVKDRGIQSLLRIEMTPFLSSKETHQEWLGEKTHYIYPTHIASFSFPRVDFLFILDEHTASFLIKYHLFHLGAMVKEAIIVMLPVKISTIFSDCKDPAFFLDSNQRINSFNDNYIRSQLHLAGFFHVECIYSEGKNIADNYFDKKITHVSYKNGFSVVKKNQQPRKKNIPDDRISTKIYVANKLPSSQVINPHS
ncbi:MAG TPA: hypothetical protein VJH96_03375 [Patescibacteria group bacterium]|nr:hypothetical protein [Patescibacteria group bacterium]